MTRAKTKAATSDEPCTMNSIMQKVQMARVYADSKTFVDLKLKVSEELVLHNFRQLQSYPNPDQTQLKDFVEANFEKEEDAATEAWWPPGFRTTPEYMNDLSAKTLLEFSNQANELWLTLARKYKKNVGDEDGIFSLLYSNNGYIAPSGDRLSESNDPYSYWIIRGLLISNMNETVEGLLENFLGQVERFGYIPSGSRKYYLGRTQMPYLCSMVSKYVERNGNKDFLKRCLPTLEKEMRFYETKRRLKYNWEGNTYTCFHFSADGEGPRPECYFEDVQLAEKFETNEDKEEFYLHLKAGAESGWDFSSRWFIDPEGGNAGPLTNIKTGQILPVDLNALMYRNYKLLALFNRLVGKGITAAYYEAMAADMMRSLNELFWDPGENMWFDVDKKNGKRRMFYYGSNLYPLWAEAYPPEMAETMAKCTVDYLKRNGLTEFKGGVPSSKQHTGQQSDWNACAPIQQYVVSGLNKTKSLEAQETAFIIAKNYTLGTIASCNKDLLSCDLYEKYDPSTPGSAGGGGGEYTVQTGFGSTNGVLIDFIAMYGDQILTSDEYNPVPTPERYGLKGDKIKYATNCVRFGHAVPEAFVACDNSETVRDITVSGESTTPASGESTTPASGESTTPASGESTTPASGESTTTPVLPSRL